MGDVYLASSKLGFSSFLLRLLRGLPFFGSQRWLFLAFFFWISILGHTVRFLSVTFQIYVQIRPAVRIQREAVFSS